MPSVARALLLPAEVLRSRGASFRGDGRVRAGDAEAHHLASRWAQGGPGAGAILVVDFRVAPLERKQQKVDTVSTRSWCPNIPSALTNASSTLVEAPQKRKGS